MDIDISKVNPDIFHDHLDVCRRCREEPFNMCSEGERLLHKAAGVDLAIPESDLELLGSSQIGEEMLRSVERNLEKMGIIMPMAPRKNGET